jgi:outer membrane protein assembly factor BamB
LAGRRIHVNQILARLVASMCVLTLVTGAGASVAHAEHPVVARLAPALQRAAGGLRQDQKPVDPNAPSATTAPGDSSLTANDWDSPLYDNGVLYVGASDGVTGIDPMTGSIIIHYRTRGPVVTTPAVLRGFDPQPDPPGKLVVGSVDGTLSVFSTNDAVLLWRVRLGAEPTSPLAIQGEDPTDDIVIVGAGDTLLAFHGNGTRIWDTDLRSGDISKGGAVMIDQTNELIAVTAGRNVYALDAATGAVVWAAAA